MHMGRSGLSLLKKFEACKLKAYKGPGETNYTIGWGHCGPDVKQGQIITQEEADRLLKQDLIPREEYVTKYVTTFKPNQNQFDALVDYVYNRGLKGLKQLCENSKTAEDFSKNILVYWGSNTAVKNGIMRRRNAEKELFDTPIGVSDKKLVNPYMKPTTVLKLGSIGPDVSWVQWQLLNKFNYNIAVDGDFGNKTLKAVKDFQSNNRLLVDGKVGQKTINALV